MDLFDKALTMQHAAAWAREFNMTPAALSIAKRQRRLSPVLAGNLAIKLGENPEHWMAIAAMEAEPESPLLANLKARFRECRFTSMERRQKLRKNNTDRRSTLRSAFFSPDCLPLQKVNQNKRQDGENQNSKESNFQRERFRFSFPI